MVVNKIYTKIYSSNNLETGSRASVSADLCEKVISTISMAKESLNIGDKPGWFETLAKVPNEMGLLISTINTDNLGELGEKMQKFYLQISLNISALICEDMAPSKADEMIVKLREARDIWRDLHIQYLHESKGNIAGSGDLI